MRKKTELRIYAEQKAKETGLKINTVWKILISLKQEGQSEDDIERVFEERIEQAKQVQASRQNHTVRKDLVILNSYLVFDLLQDRFRQLKGTYNFSDEITSKIIRHPKDSYKTEVLIQAEQSGKPLFGGFNLQDVFLINAISNAYDNAETSVKKGYVKVGKDAEIFGDYKTLSLQEIFNFIHPGKRFDRLSAKQVKDLIQALSRLRQQLTALNAVYNGERLENGLYLLNFGWQKVNEDYYINVHVNNKSVIHLIRKQKRLVTIPREALNFGTVKNGLFYLYIAYRVFLSKHKNRMKNLIGTKKAFALIGGKIELKKIKAYMQFLADNGYIKAFEVTRGFISWAYPNAGRENLIVCRDAEKNEIKKEKTAEIEDVERRLQEINEFTGRYKVTFRDKRLDTALHAVYNNADWTQGGRLYTGTNGLQALKSAERQEVKINGRETVQIDFSCLHPHLIYSLMQADFPEDAYNFYPIRQLAKKAFNIALNAENRTQAENALKQYIREAGLIGKPDEIFSRMEKKHEAIQGFFFSGAGLRLQNTDAQLALNILSRMRSKRVCCLPVHDSFIVDRRFADTLAGVMKEEYRKITGFDIEIKSNEEKSSENHVCEVRV